MKKWLTLLAIALILIILPKTSIFAVECGQAIPGDPAGLSEYISKCQKLVDDLKKEQQTLTAAISSLDTKIKITQAQITQTGNQIKTLESEISTLSTVITDLDTTLDDLAEVYVARVRESYKRRDPSPTTLFLSSDSFAKFFTRIRYLNIVKARDQIILSEMQTAKNNYNLQKEAKIVKQAEVESLKLKLTDQQASLNIQQKSKTELLKITQNDEKKYQDLISQAKAELEAINAIVGGSGKETEVGDVNKGDHIANIIQGASCNSGGSHLHFIVAENSITQNPFSYLKPVDHTNCSGSSCGSSDGDPFNPTGSWDWPINPSIQYNQGYGATWATKNTWVGNIYSFHNGIDISSDSPDVRAVQSGRLFRGSYTGSNGCALKYVRVDHKDSNLETFYLHVNYF